MIVLGIDTAASMCAVSAVSRSGVVAGRATLRPRAHAELLMTMIDDCMNDARRAGHDGRGPGAVAVSGGPGSFTGLRIGFSVAKGICSATGSALVVVPTFEAWAAAAVGLPNVPEGSAIITVMSAGRGEAFVASFRSSAGGVSRTTGPSLVRARDLAGLRAGGRAPLIVGETRAELSGWFPSGGADWFAAIADDGLDVAGRVALIGLEKFERGAVSDAAAAEPMYGREFSTTTPKEQKGRV